MPLPRRHGHVLRDGVATFRLWAPHASEVALELRGESVPLDELGGGWFAAERPAEDGDRYGFRLDDGDVRPDPAARWLPDGVHEAAAVLDVARFRWSASEDLWRPPPLGAGAIYELHVGTFTAEGTLDAAREHLEDLAALGIGHVELLPLNAFNGTAGWGYDGVAWWAVHEPYGGPHAFARFVDAAHRAGLAVVVDAVFNHLGPSGNYLPDFGPYLRRDRATPWGDAINLDGPQSDAVRRYVVEAALSWFVDYHVDALRLDAVHGLVDDSATHVLAELSAAVERLGVRLGRPLQLIAESDRNDPATVRPRVLGGMGLDAQWSDDLHHAIHVAVTGEREGYYVDYVGLPDVAYAYRHGFVYDGARFSEYRERTLGAPLPGDVSGHALVTHIQNHDQVGNRAAGDRLTTLAPQDLQRVAIVLLCAAPHVPMLFMGEEHAEVAPFQFFTSHPEEELAQAVREGRREEFASFAAFSGTEVPDPQDPQTVRRSTLDRNRAATSEGRQRRALWEDLLRLRRSEPALGNGRRDLVDVLEVADDALLLVRRDPDAPPVALAVNLDGRPRPGMLLAGAGWELLLSSADPRYGGDGVPDGSWPARSAALYRAVA